MKKAISFIKVLVILILAGTFLFLVFVPKVNEADIYHSMKFVCYNIRLHTLMDFGLHMWEDRRPLIKDQLYSKDPDVICMQEVKETQYAHLIEDYSSDYEIYWAGRDDSYNTEGLAVLYKKDKYTLVEKGMFWLSETPDVSSKDWGTTFPRICVYVTLQYVEDGKEVSFTVYNVHLDHISEYARIKGLELVNKVAKEKGNKTIICGDFNANEESECYLELKKDYDSSREVARKSDSGATYNGYGKVNKEGSPIDHIFVDKSIRVDLYDNCQEVPNSDKVKHYSDHNALYTELKIPYEVVEDDASEVV